MRIEPSKVTATFRYSRVHLFRCSSRYRRCDFGASSSSNWKLRSNQQPSPSCCYRRNFSNQTRRYSFGFFRSLLTNLLKDWDLLVRPMMTLSEERNAIFSMSKILAGFPRSGHEQLTPKALSVINALRKRGLLVKIDNYPRYRLIGVSTNDFRLPSVQQVNCITEHEIETLEKFAFLAKLSISIPALSKSTLVQKITPQQRTTCAPIVDTFLSFMQVYENNRTLDDILCCFVPILAIINI